MSITEEQNLIRNSIESNFIKYYDHTEFKNKKEIKSSVGKIFKANFSNTNTSLVVKIPYELDIKKIVNEVFKHIKKYNLYI
jgi:hypothetical protein